MSGTDGIQSSMNGGLVELTAQIALPGFRMNFSRNEEIFGEEEEADFVYKVISGAVRTTRMLNDGRRKVCGFFLPGDVFGLEFGDAHRCSAEAVADCEVALVRRPALERAVDRDPAAARELWAMTARTLQRLEDHMLMLGRKSAAERVAGFLLEMAERADRRDAVDLPMSRLDIADYLGLTIETVSRTMTHLEREQVIAMPTSRHVVLRDRRALSENLN